MIASGEDLSVNNFMDWNASQKAAFFNYKPETLGKPISSLPLQSTGLSLSASSYDWRTLNRVTSIKDQGGCGSCWAFASTAQYESLLSRQTSGTLYDLSEQYAIECERSSFGCSGGFPYTALSLYQSTGIPLETSFPYVAQAKYYSNLGKPICTDSNRIKLTSSVLSVQHYTNLTREQIQQQLSDNGPLSVAVYASNSAFQYAGKSGLINSCPSGGVDHAVLLVGYNTTHWFIKNSWGTGWGNNGFGYILKDNDCGLSTWVDVMQIQNSNTNTPNKTGYIDYNITMTDSAGDGWNGNILAFKQDGVVVATFGSGFTSGSSYSQSIRIKNDVQTQIVVVQKGNFTNEVGFSIKTLTGSVLHNRDPGTAFDATIIFKTFCPSSSCPTSTTIDYTASLSDSYGDGWNGVILAFRQNTTTQTFGQNFTSGAEYTPTAYTFTKGKSVDIIVSTAGYWT